MIQPNPHPGVSLSHDQARELIQKSLQARLDACEQTALETHLAGCPACAAYAAEMRSLDLRLATGLPERWPERRYSAAEMDRRLDGMHIRLRRVTLWRSALSFGSLAGAALVLVTLILVLNQVARLAAPRPVEIAGGPIDNRTVETVVAAIQPTVASVSINQAVVPSADGVAREAIASSTTVDAPTHASTATTTAFPSPAAPTSLMANAAQPTGTPAAPVMAAATESLLVKVAQATPSPVTMNLDASEVQPSGQLTQAGAEKLIRAWIFANQPKIDSQAQFPLEELSPPDMWVRLQAQIFKVTAGVQQNEVYLVRKGEVLHLGNAFGSTGMTLEDFVLCNLDSNSVPELLYTYPFGSGITQTGLGIVQLDWQDRLAQHEYTNLEQATLRLEKFTDRQVYLTRQVAGTQEWIVFGQVILSADGIAIQRDTSPQATYTSERYGVSFNYPASWVRQQRPDGHESFSGLTGDFDLYSLGVGRTDEDLARACEQQANSSNKLYNGQPQIVLTQNIQQRSLCFLVGDAQARSSLLFLAPNDQIAILWADSAHLLAIGTSLRFTTAQSSLSPGGAAVNMTPQAPPAKLDETTQKLNGLNLTEWKVVSASVDTPSHFEFNTRIPQNILGRRSAAGAGSQAWVNQQLAPFGYRLEGPTSSTWGQVYALYHGDTLIKGNLSMFAAPSTSDKDFAMLVEEAGAGKRWLVRKDSSEPWDDMLHRYTRPIFVNGHLMTVEREGNAVQSDGVVVKQDGQVVFRYTLAPQPVKETVRALDEWNGQWVLEVNGALIVSGQVYNTNLAAGEIFNWNKLNGRPFFFFTRSNGQVGLWYNGQELSVAYDAVIHNQCCEPAAFNVINSPSGVWFYALKDGAWYFVELKLGQ